MLIKILIALLFLTFPLGQVVRWEFFGGQLTLRPNDLIALLLGGLGLLKINGPLKTPLLLWFGAMILSLTVNIFNYSPTELLISSLYTLRFILYAGLYFVFRNLKINKYLIWVCLGISFLGFVQYLYIPDITFLAQYNWDPHYYRLVSTFLDPSFTGIILLLGMLLCHSGLFRIFIYFAFALTYSRTSFLAFLVAYGLIAWFKKSPQIFVKSLLVIVFTIIILPRTFGDGTKLDRETSTWARINNWRDSIIIWSKAPIFGVGFNTYRYASGASLQSHSGAGADSSLFLVLATTGIVGFIFYVNLLRVIWKQNNNYIFRAGFLAIFVASFFCNSLFYPFIMQWLWISAGAKENI